MRCPIKEENARILYTSQIELTRLHELAENVKILKSLSEAGFESPTTTSALEGALVLVWALNKNGIATRNLLPVHRVERTSDGQVGHGDLCSACTHVFSSCCISRSVLQPHQHIICRVQLNAVHSLWLHLFTLVSMRAACCGAEGSRAAVSQYQELAHISCPCSRVSVGWMFGALIQDGDVADIVQALYGCHALSSNQH